MWPLHVVVVLPLACSSQCASRGSLRWWKCHRDRSRKVLFNTCSDIVHCPLNRFRCVLSTKQRTYKTEKAVTRCNCSLRSFFFFSLYLPIFIAGVKCREDWYFTDGFDALFHFRNWIGVLSGWIVELPMVSLEADEAILFGANAMCAADLVCARSRKILDTVFAISSH